MKAAVIDRQGGPEGRVYRDMPDPEPGPGDAVVRVRAAGLNHCDVLLRRGTPGLDISLPFISGSDIAGEIEALGGDVTGWQIGEPVAVYPATSGGILGMNLHGGLAERVKVPAANLVRLSDNVAFDVAAALPVAYGAAHRMLTARGRIQPGETVLVLGASGGVGTASVLLAKLIGARVIAAAGSEEKLRRLLEIGADHVVNSSVEDFSREVWRLTRKRGVDAAINFTGGDTWTPSIRALRPRGRLIVCGATAGFVARTDLRYVWEREIDVLGSNRFGIDDLTTVLDFVATGRLRPVISHVLPLSECREAEWLMERRAAFGKVILLP